MAVLEVGLEEVGDVAGLGASLDHPRAQGVEPAAAVAAPPRRALRRQAGAELVVAGERAGAEQRRRRVEVVGGEGELLVERAHGVAELEPGVPQRVPQRRGQLVDATRPAVVDEQDVDVALRRQLPRPYPPTATRATAARRRRVTILDDGVGEQPAQQLVGGVGQRTAQLPAAERAVGDQLVPLGGGRQTASAKGTGSAAADAVVTRARIVAGCSAG